MIINCLRQYAPLLVLGLMLVTMIFISLAVGPSGWAPLSLGHHILNYRLSRIMLAIIAGSSLAASGASLQAMFQNPLADPYLFGISGGAAVGAALVISFLDNSLLLLPSTGAVIGSLLAFSLVFYYLNSKEIPPLSECLLIGVLINAVAASIITLLKTTLPPTKTQSLLFWLVGNLGVVERGNWYFIIPLWVFGMALLLMVRNELEILSFGIDESRILGINHKSIIKIAVVANCMLIANVVSFAGMIGFIGLVVPQMVRIYYFDLRVVLPIASFLGALVLLLFDTMSRLSFFLVKSEIPVGALVALFIIANLLFSTQAPL